MFCRRFFGLTLAVALTSTLAFSAEIDDWDEPVQDAEYDTIDAYLQEQEITPTSDVRDIRQALKKLLDKTKTNEERDEKLLELLESYVSLFENIKENGKKCTPSNIELFKRHMRGCALRHLNEDNENLAVQFVIDRARIVNEDCVRKLEDNLVAISLQDFDQNKLDLIEKIRGALSESRMNYNHVLLAADPQDSKTRTFISSFAKVNSRSDGKAVYSVLSSLSKRQVDELIKENSVESMKKVVHGSFRKACSSLLDAIDEQQFDPMFMYKRNADLAEWTDANQLVNIWLDYRFCKILVNGHGYKQLASALHSYYKAEMEDGQI